MLPFSQSTMALLVVISLVLVACVNAVPECLSGWNYNPQNQHCYRIVLEDRKNPFDCKKSCLEDDAYLVQIEDRNELEYLQSISPEKNASWYIQLYWTGGVKVKNTWFWKVLDLQGYVEHIPMTQDFWEPGEPTNMGGTEDLAVLAVHSDGYAGLNVFPPSYRLAYICEKS